jgi:hypothetical protein
MNVSKKEIRPGWWAEIVPLTFGRARIIVTDGTFIENGW